MKAIMRLSPGEFVRSERGIERGVFVVTENQKGQVTVAMTTTFTDEVLSEQEWFVESLLVEKLACLKLGNRVENAITGEEYIITELCDSYATGTKTTVITDPAGWELIHTMSDYRQSMIRH